jgi:hypothetical protein
MSVGQSAQTPWAYVDLHHAQGSDRPGARPGSRAVQRDPVLRSRKFSSHDPHSCREHPDSPYSPHRSRSRCGPRPTTPAPGRHHCSSCLHPPRRPCVDIRVRLRSDLYICGMRRAGRRRSSRRRRGRVARGAGAPRAARTGSGRGPSPRGSRLWPRSLRQIRTAPKQRARTMLRASPRCPSGWPLLAAIRSRRFQTASTSSGSSRTGAPSQRRPATGPDRSGQ